MSYVDLNPIRAKMAKTPESSEYTSIQQRINQDRGIKEIPVHLIKLFSNPNQGHPNSIAFSLTDYCQLVDTLGRAILQGKRGFIEPSETPILHRLNIDCDGFLELMNKKDDLSQLTAIASTVALTHYIERIERKFIKGLTLNQRIFT